MPSLRKPTLRGRQLARALRPLILSYWRTPEAKWGALLLVAAVALELFAVQAIFFVAEAQRNVVDDLESRNAAGFAAAVGTFVALALVQIVVSAYRIYLRQLVEIRWRRGLTADYLNRWIDTGAYCQSQLHGTEIDNPDQRIAEDARDFVASALGLSLSLLSAIASLYAFGGLLWRLSAGWEILLLGRTLAVPGLLLWVAALFAVLSMALTHLVGRRLVPINFNKLRCEADFRYGLVRFRDNIEQVALSHGESVERLGAIDRFRYVVGAFLQLVRAERNLNLVTQGVAQLSGILPILLAAPAYFANLLTLGTILQARIAYDQVSAALNWFVNAYREIARWRANIERLDSFAQVMERTAGEVAAAGLQVVPSTSNAIRLADVRLETPQGRVLVDRANAQLAAGERVAIEGESGTGKTTLFRALAGIWPFGAGRIERPDRERMLFVPQRPYLPLGTLRAAISYPATEGAFPDSRIQEVMKLIGLAHLTPRLDLVEPWDQRLSVHEQQLLSLARVLLQEPDWLLLDESTSGLDEALERRLYELVLARLPHAALVTIGVRSGARALLPRHWNLVERKDGTIELEAA
jgi:vitamin B12/bleomycin/antimicrobial peptide transport system ATP-binding/permease protein